MRIPALSPLAAALAAALLVSSPALADEPASDPPAEAADDAAKDDAAAGADEAPPAEDAKAPAADAGSFGGDWKSDWGDVVVKVSGKTVTGSWHDGEAPGEFSGEIDENGVLVYSWTQADTSGKGTFVMTNGKLVGRWGYGTSANNGGDWMLWRAEK